MKKNFFKSIGVFVRALPDILMYELIFKLLLLSVGAPLLTLLLKLTMKISHVRYLSDEKVWIYLKNPATIIALLLILFFSAMFSFMELSGLAACYSCYYRGERLSVIGMFRTGYHAFKKAFRGKGLLCFMTFMVYMPIAQYTISSGIFLAPILPILRDAFRAVNTRGALAVYIGLQIVFAILIVSRSYSLHFLVLTDKPLYDCTIESRKSRLITIALVPFMSCAGRLPIFVLLVGAFFPKTPALALMCIYLLGVVLAILSALVLKRVIKDDDLPFVMELPPYRIPTAKAIGRHTWEKGKQYLQKMATTILVASIVIWALGYYPKNEGLPRSEQQEQSFLGHIGKAVAPVLDPLGFDWRMDVGLLTGVAAKELVVSSLGVMYAGEEGDAADENDTALQSALKNNVPLPAAVAFMIFVLLYFPCIATFVAIKNETGRWSWAWGICAYTIVVAWIVAWIGKMICQMLI